MCLCEHDIEEIQRNQESYAIDLANSIDTGVLKEEPGAEMLDCLAIQGLALVPIKMIGKNVASHAYLGAK